MKENLLAVLCLLLLVGPVTASDGKVSGYMFGDYYYVTSNHNKQVEDQNGFWFRRIYLTYDQGLGERLDVRLRFEMNSAGDFSSNSKLTPAVKDAYLRWKYASHSFIFGIQSVPTWELIEKVWGYRSVEKTPLDLHKFGASRDFGLAARGSLGSGKRVNYHLMLANGSSNGSEVNRGKKVMLALSTKLSSNLVVEGYADFEERPGSTNRFTLQGFAAYQSDNARVGFHFARQERQVAPGVDDLSLQLGSVFAATRLSPRLWGFARVDRLFDPNPDGEGIAYLPFNATAKATFFLVGVDFCLAEGVHIIPNAEATIYNGVAGVSPATDLMPRVTFYYIWK